MCQGFSKFEGFLHNFVLAKLATSSIEANILSNVGLGKLSSPRPCGILASLRCLCVRKVL